MYKRLRCLKFLAISLCACLAFTASGARREYRVSLDGTRLKGSEVCFFAAESAKDPFALFFSYDHVGCLPADQVLDFPSGVFHVFARHSAGYVGAYHEFVVYPPDTEAEVGYNVLEIPLSEAGRVDFSSAASGLRDGETLGVWISFTPDGGAGFYMPLVSGERLQLVPANTGILPMVVANMRPVRIGDPMVLAPGSERSAKFSKSGGGDVVAWIRAERSPAEIDWPTADPPEVLVVAGESEFKPLFPPGRHRPLHDLLFFKGIPPGPAQIRVKGETWRDGRIDLSVNSGEVSVAGEPLMIRPAAAIEIVKERETGSAPVASCRETDHGPVMEVKLSRCGSPDSKSSRCEPVGTVQTAWDADESLVFGQLPAGSYSVTVDDRISKPRAYPVELAIGKRTRFLIPVRDGFRVYGTVTLDGRPLRARLLFSNGSAFSDELGQYLAVLPSDPLLNNIAVLPCEGTETHKFVPTESPKPNTPLDIIINRREVVVSARDADDRPLGDVRVTFSPVSRTSPELRTSYTSDPVTTGSDGVARLQVPEGTPMIFCGEAPDLGVVRGCTTLVTSREIASSRPVVLKLNGPAFRGRVDGHVGHGVLALVGAAGTIVEEATLRADSEGRFVMRRRPRAGDYVVYSSTARPLFVMGLPREWQEEVVFTLPSAPVRTFRVSAPATGRAGWVGMWVDGRYVPLQVLVYHQDPRGLDVRLEPGSTLTIRDVAETGPITVAIAPDPPMSSSSPFVDPFTEPQNASLPRYAVTGPVVVLTR